MKNLKFLYFFLFILLLAFEVKAELTFEYHVGVRPAKQLSLIDADGDIISNDLLEDPTGIAFSSDGLKAFATNKKATASGNGKCVVETTLTVPYDFRETHTQTDRSDVLANTGLSGDNAKCEDIKFSHDGLRMLISSSQGFIHSFELTKPFSLKHINYGSESEESFLGQSFDINDDGTKLFTMRNHNTEKTLKEYSLSTPYDVTTATEIQSTSLGSTLVIDESYSDDTNKDPPQGLEFSKDGSMLFILIINNSDEIFKSGDFMEDEIFQFKLTTPFDTSTMSLVGSSNVTSGYPQPPTVSVNSGDYSLGFTISPNGDRLFIINQSVGPGDIGNDSISQVKLSCFFGIGACRTDIVSGIGSHVEVAKKNIHFNNSTMFKRFEWIKRNRDSENLNNFNVNLKSYNPILASLTNKLQASLDNNSSKIKSSTWSFWSTGDVSMGRQDATITDRPKEIHTSGLTFGADKKFGGDKFAGFALRYAQNDSSVTFTDQSSDMESLTLNFYGTIPKNETNYTNLIIGYSLLRIDQKYQGKKTGNRNGHQLFTSANFRSKNKSGRFNFSPSGKFSYGITKLSDYTDFISLATTGANDQHEDKTLKSGNLAIGFLFDTDSYKFPDSTVTPNGGFEFVMDVSPETSFTYDNGQSSTLVDVYSTKNLKGNLGFEVIFTNDSTLSLNYERFQHLDLGRSGKTETFIVKIGKIIEGDSEFAFNYEPIQNNQMELSYVKDVNGFDVKVSSNYSAVNQIPDYGANIEVSTKF
ncbi:MAG: autotransporter outer membrane beta-barrel domain-containing protein [Candidatus Pelagibacter sp.]